MGRTVLNIVSLGPCAAGASHVGHLVAVLADYYVELNALAYIDRVDCLLGIVLQSRLVEADVLLGVVTSDEAKAEPGIVALHGARHLVGDDLDPLCRHFLCDRAQWRESGIVLLPRGERLSKLKKSPNSRKSRVDVFWTNFA